MGAIFTVDWESWKNAIYPIETWRRLPNLIEEPTNFLLDILDKYEVTAIFYVLGWLRYECPYLYSEIERRGHVIGDHGYWHGHNEKSDYALFRSPYWDTTPMPSPPSGGFFFRAMPYQYVKWAVKRSGQFWIHPHDVMNGHPKLDNKLLNLKRQYGLKTARAKLDRLLQHIEWDSPR